MKIENLAQLKALTRRGAVCPECGGPVEDNGMDGVDLTVICTNPALTDPEKGSGCGWSKSGDEF